MDRGAPSTAPSRRRSIPGLAVQLSAMALTFVLIALLVVTSSRAAFVAQNENVTNQVTAATIDLADNDSSTAMFDTVTGLMPGTDQDRCIDVTYTGSVNPLPVLLYASAPPTGSLGQYLTLTIDIGNDTAAPFRDCTGFTSSATVYSGTLAAFAAARADYATGLSTWDPAGGPETRTFRFRLSVQDVPAAEGQTATFGFSWETRTS
jgi:hypothetical protein